MSTKGGPSRCQAGSTRTTSPSSGLPTYCGAITTCLPLSSRRRTLDGASSHRARMRSSVTTTGRRTTRSSTVTVRSRCLIGTAPDRVAASGTLRCRPTPGCRCIRSSTAAITQSCLCRCERRAWRGSAPRTDASRSPKCSRRSSSNCASSPTSFRPRRTRAIRGLPSSRPGTCPREPGSTRRSSAIRCTSCSGARRRASPDVGRWHAPKAVGPGVGEARLDVQRRSEQNGRSSRRGSTDAAQGGVIVRKLKVSTFVTLDGVMQAPGGPEEDRTGGFTQGGWSVGYWDDRMGQVMGDFMGRPFELLLGRRTYEIFAAYWPHSSEPGAEALNGARKHVASRTLKNVEWNNSALIKGDVPMYVSELKKQSGPEIQVHGSGDLIQTLLRNDLVDEFHLWTFPAVLGSGKRLFAGGAIPAGLKIVDVTTSSTGVVIATYERAGEIKYGSFALDEPSVDELERRPKVASG